MPPRPQEALFYNDSWTRAMDDIFIDSIAREARKGHFWVGLNNTHAVLMAQADVQRRTGRVVSLAACRGRLTFLENRYEAWNYLMNHPDVLYVPDQNRVYAAGSTWVKMCRENNYVVGYFYDGEPKVATFLISSVKLVASGFEGVE